MSGDQTLSEQFAEAAKIASVVPESMQEAAFHRALDALQAQSGEASSADSNSARKSKSGNRSKTASRKTTGSTSSTHEAQPDVIQAFLTLSRDQATDVDSFDNTLGKSMAVLRVAHRELDVDGMTAPQIFAVLSEKFRWKIDRRSIASALDGAGRMVDRKRVGQTVVFRLMSEGKNWLDGGGQQESRAKSRPTPKPGAKKKKPATPSSKGSSAPVSGEPAEKAKRPARKTSSAKSGPKAALEALILEGYFVTPRTLGAVRTSLEHDRALRFKTTDLSPTLVRLLRDGKLTRAKNTDGQYEYTTSSA